MGRAARETRLEVPTISRLRLFALVILSLVAFAGNSVLTRLALNGTDMSATAFACVRILAGGLTLWGLILGRRTTKSPGNALGGNWASALWLFGYAIPFSFAYEHLDTGTGALILFGCVQLTMILVGLRQGDRPPPLKWLGLVAAILGLVYLLLPGAQAPSPGAAALMGIAGISWGAYSLRGRGSLRPAADTGGNMLRASVCVMASSALYMVHAEDSFRVGGSKGLGLALLSGSLASGVGYALWYAALPHLKSITAATLQLSVPIVASVGGVLLVDEAFTQRLALSSVLVIGGTAMALLAGSRVTSPKSS